MFEQEIITSYSQLDNYLAPYRKIMLVCGGSIKHLKINVYFKSLEKRFGIDVVRFSDFLPNPTYESVVKGVKLYRIESCQLIIAVGGGSAMDVAKCIKLYAKLPYDDCFLKQDIIPNDIPFIAVPTTAGTGSEATRFAVVYYNGEKQSIADNSIIPSIVLMDASFLNFLPLYQKKATMLDAFCHAVESFWSINSTVESKIYSKNAIQMIIANYKGYLANKEECNVNMLQASYFSGKAINITQTTAGHAMSYKLTSLYNIPHGYACAFAVSVLWHYMNENIDKCIDPRGNEYLAQTLDEIGKAMGYNSSEAGCCVFRKIVFSHVLPTLNLKSDEDFKILTTSVNPIRLKNHPIALNEQVINDLYHQIFQLCK